MDTYNWKFNSSTLKCSTCDQTFHTKSTLKRHSNKCKPGPDAQTTANDQRNDREQTKNDGLEPESKNIKPEVLEPDCENDVELSGRPKTPSKRKSGDLQARSKIFKVSKKSQISLEEKYYYCNSCAYSTTMKHNFERHALNHKKTMAFQCFYCSFSSAGKNIVKAHGNSYHSSEKPMEPIEVSKIRTANDDTEEIANASRDESPKVKSLESIDDSSVVKDTLVRSPVKVKMEKEADCRNNGPIQRDINRPDQRAAYSTKLRSRERLSTLAAFQDLHDLPKYHCPDCPYKTNAEDQYRTHVKCHRVQSSSRTVHECPHCSFSTPKASVRDNHLKLHKANDVYTPEESAGTLISDACRCQLAEKMKCPDLACNRQLACPCCSVKSPSVDFLRSHALGHVDLLVALRFFIFDPRLDSADGLLVYTCTKNGTAMRVGER